LFAWRNSPYTCIRDVVTSLAGKLASKLISNRWANIEEVKHMDDPILIIHGQRDTLIPYSHSEVPHSHPFVCRLASLIWGIDVRVHVYVSIIAII
jgi:hypothetical protein